MSHVMLFLFVGLLAWAAFTDARDYLISNRICIAVAVLFPAYALASDEVNTILPAALVGFGVLAFGVLMFSRGFLGGGDVKLMAAVSLWAGPALILPFIFVTGIAGGLLSVAIAVPRLFMRGGTLAAAPPVPYGVAVAAGGLYVASRLLAGI